MIKKSLPSRERGLKSTMARNLLHEYNVAPLAGAWIEVREKTLLRNK